MAPSSTTALGLTANCPTPFRVCTAAARTASVLRPRAARLQARLPSQPASRPARQVAVQSSNEGESKVVEAVEDTTENAPKVSEGSKPLGKGVNLFDPAATASRFLTRRFGIVGGLGFVAFLASTEGYEIVKALLERDSEGSGEVIQTPSGLAYKDIKVGGGVKPKAGDFVGAHFLVKVGDETLLDTKKTGRPVAFTFAKRPYLSVNCEGVEEGLSTMKRGGVRELILPPELAYGQESRELPGGAIVPPGSTVTVVVTLEDVTGSYL